MSDRVPMTVVGHRQLKVELKQLKSIERPKISHEIEVARAHGDLSENAEYHAAKDKQGFIEGRILEVESQLVLADVIDPMKYTGDRIVFGAYVTLIDAETEDEVTYQIVGLDEADIKQKKISVTSPMSRAMIGKSEGDGIEVNSPKGGAREYEVLKVEYRAWE